MDYPANARDQALRAWQDPDPTFNMPNPPPDAAVALRLLEAIYEASLMTEESARFETRVVIANAAALQRTGQVRITQLATPFRFTAASLIKIAPAIDSSQAALAVFPNAQGELMAWAIVDEGGGAFRLRMRTGTWAYSPPTCFFVESTEPGHLKVSQGEIPLVELRRGAIPPRAPHFMSEAVTGGFFARAVGELRAERQALICEEGEYEPNDLAERLYRSFLSLALYTVRDRGRGGTLVIVGRPLAGAGTVRTNLTVTKYAATADHAWNTLQRRHHDVADNVLELSDVAKFYGSLGAVDGALILSDRLQLEEFGAKLTPPNGLQQVHVQGAGPVTKPIREFGTRHSSAMRYCHTVPEAIAYVVSEDGEIRAVRRQGADVFYWPKVSLDQD